MAKVNRRLTTPRTHGFEMSTPKIGQKQLEQSKRALLQLRNDGSVYIGNDKKYSCKCSNNCCCKQL